MPEGSYMIGFPSPVVKALEKYFFWPPGRQRRLTAIPFFFNELATPVDGRGGPLSRRP
jgi:hypothetical protein